MVATSATSFLGSYSGITMDTVNQMIEAESGKLVKFTNKQASLTSEKNAWKDINTRLDSLSKKIEALKDTSTFQTKKVSNSNEELVTITGDSKAINSEYRLSVEQLATSSQLTFGKIDMGGKTLEDPLNLSGTLSFTEADEAEAKFTITVKAEQSLKDIVKDINDQAKSSESSLKASIIDSRIVLTDSRMGERNITVSGSLSSELGLTEATLEMGKSSKMTINGISVERNSNTIDDVVEGISITLNKAAVGETTKIGITDDKEKAVKAVQEFIDQYNSTMSYISESLDAGDPSAEKNKTGVLVGDGSVMRLQSQMREMLSVKETGSSAVKSLKDLGIEVDRYGKAALDASKLKKTLDEEPNTVQDFFYKKETIKEADGSSSFKETGITQKLGSFVNGYINAKTGVIASKSTSLDLSIKDMDKQIERFNERLETKRQQYIKQFTALDTAMMQAESQMEYLVGQVNSMTGKGN